MSQVPQSQGPLVLSQQPAQAWQFVPRQPIDGFNGFGNEIRTLLERPFEPSQIKRDVKRHTDGFEPIYVEAPAIIQRLNDVFNGEWSFQIVSEQLVPPHQPTQVIIKGRLTVGQWINSQIAGPVRRDVVKEQFGSCFLKTRSEQYVDIGSDYKAAATDALKKCATQLGIALDLYVKDETPMQGMHRTGPVDGQGSFPQVQTNPNSPAEVFQIEAVRQMFAKMNVPDGHWQQALQLTSPQQVTQGLVQQLLSGQHPYVQSLMQQTGQQVGLRASAA